LNAAAVLGLSEGNWSLLLLNVQKLLLLPVGLGRVYEEEKNHAYIGVEVAVSL